MLLVVAHQHSNAQKTGVPDLTLLLFVCFSGQLTADMEVIVLNSVNPSSAMAHIQQALIRINHLPNNALNPHLPAHPATSQS